MGCVAGGGFGDGVVVYRQWLTKSALDTTSRSSRKPGPIVESVGALAHKHLPLRFRVVAGEAWRIRERVIERWPKSGTPD